MVSSIYTDKKGIYKDLYRELNAENNKKQKAEKAYQFSRQRKGIYTDLYRQLNEDKSVDKELWHTYPLKIMVYSNDIGEALRPIIGGLLAKLSWIPTIIYALLAILSKCFNAKENKKDSVNREILFQIFAGFLLPLMLIKTVGKAANKVLDNISLKMKDSIKNPLKQLSWMHKLFEKSESKKASGYRNVCVTTAGIFALAIAVRPIDKLVDNSLDRIYSRG